VLVVGEQGPVDHAGLLGLAEQQDGVRQKQAPREVIGLPGLLASGMEALHYPGGSRHSVAATCT
jgi:hypothetical protein